MVDNDFSTLSSMLSLEGLHLEACCATFQAPFNAEGMLLETAAMSKLSMLTE